MNASIDGVTKFSAEHTNRPLTRGRYREAAAQVTAWREILVRLGFIGQDPARYGGAGYGNISARVGPFPGARGRRGFIVTGTRTGGRWCMGLDGLCHVVSYDLHRNHVESVGATPPSSESMTHGAMYDLGPHIRYVFHGHSPEIWRGARALRLPTTAPSVAYGTPEMAFEVQRLARETSLLDGRLLAMGGHEDGVVAFGHTAQAAGQALMNALAKVLGQSFDAGPICSPTQVRHLG